MDNDMFETEFSTYSYPGWSELTCLKGRKWWMFVLSSVFTCLACISAVLIWRLFVFVMKFFRFHNEADTLPDGPNRLNEVVRRVNRQDKQDIKIGFLSEVKNWAIELLSGRTTTGKILEGLVLVLGTLTFIFYVFDAANEYVEICAHFGSLTQQLDVAINIFFLLYFVVRFLAASDKLLFMVEAKSFVDFFTIPPFVASMFLHRMWPGLRCFRALHLLSIPIVLKNFNLLKTPRSIRLAEVICIFTSTVLIAGGIIHLLENSGDPFEFSNSQKLSYGTCLYFVVIAVSTVGFGDVFCVTVLGRTFMCFFMLIGPVMFVILMMEIFFYQNREAHRHNENCQENGQLNSDFNYLCTSTLPIQSDGKTGSREHNVVNAITHFIASSNSPLTIVERQSFKDLIETLVPGFRMPSRTAFATKEILSKVIKADLKSTKYISASLGGWTSSDRAVSLSISFISSKWELQYRTLPSRQFNSNPTAENVSQLICELLDEFDIPIEKISSITTDTAPELVQGVKGLGICYIPSFTHVIDTFIEDLFSLNDIAAILDKIDKIFNELECSTKAQSELMCAQTELNVSHNKFLSYSKPRHLSKLNKMDFVKANEMALHKFLTTYEGGKCSDLLLTKIEYRKNESLLNLLRPVEEYTNLVKNGTILTVSLTNKLKKNISNSNHTTQFEPQFKTFVGKLLSAHNEGCHFDLAEYFDPRISVDSEKLESILLALELDHQTLKRNKSGLETLLEEDDDSAVDSLNVEFLAYNSRTKIPFYANPLLWWKIKTETFPILSRICKKYLCTQATNTASDGLFAIDSSDYDASMTCASARNGKRSDVLSTNENIVEIHSDRALGRVVKKRDSNTVIQV